ncbi:MAG: hypothetical protein ACRELF_30315 [Gemmataceae bacterium]
MTRPEASPNGPGLAGAVHSDSRQRRRFVIAEAPDLGRTGNVANADAAGFGEGVADGDGTWR